MALVENLQREDLNPIEEAEGYQRLIAEFGYTQESLADRVGKDRSTVANALRLLRLPTACASLLAEGRLSMGHARALLGPRSVDSDGEARPPRRRPGSLGPPGRGAGQARARRRGGRARPRRRKAPSPNARDLGLRLSRALGTRVDVVEASPGKGEIAIHFHSLDQLDVLLARLLGE